MSCPLTVAGFFLQEMPVVPVTRTCMSWLVFMFRLCSWLWLEKPGDTEPSSSYSRSSFRARRSPSCTTLSEMGSNSSLPRLPVRPSSVARYLIFRSYSVILLSFIVRRLNSLRNFLKTLLMRMRTRPHALPRSTDCRTQSVYTDTPQRGFTLTRSSLHQRLSKQSAEKEEKWTSRPEVDVGEEESCALLLDLLIFPHSCLLNSITHRVGIQTLDKVKGHIVATDSIRTVITEPGRPDSSSGSSSPSRSNR
ncbi:hypothetical protein EYF80_054987 [Liparis tanakae]|uniref:Uncharacterized protein n=1 Tax=Liparis tanakae TaxID=230148 RepID=A0A4Z2F2Y0_9TELE|nr:hypothetical protein EYF80_054987 [Liparis tanakae]